jgi:hypothetical protein
LFDEENATGDVIKAIDGYPISRIDQFDFNIEGNFLLILRFTETNNNEGSAKF